MDFNMDREYIADITLGERLKFIRHFRKMTQKELGIACGFPEESADVRIRHYEMNRYVPKQDMIQRLASALRCSAYALCSFNNDILSITELLLWLHEIRTMQVIKFNMKPDSPYKTYLQPIYNPNSLEDLGCTDFPVGVIFQNSVINDALLELASRIKELDTGVITWEQYFNWKILWPDSGEIFKTGPDYKDWKTYGLDS